MTFDDWLGQPQVADDVLECVRILAAAHDRPSSSAAVKAGMALDEAGRMPFHQAETALENIGLRAEPVHHRLRRWPSRELPCILSLTGKRAIILHAINDGDCEITMPGAPDRIWVPMAHIEAQHTGEAIVVDVDPTREREGERPWNKTARTHWFWSEVWKIRRSFLFVMLAALIINLLAFALPLFTMNVYDRIIPNRAATSLWVLAFGVLLAISIDLNLRLARTRLVDELGRKLDSRLSQRLFEKVINLPLAARQGSTGALARRVSEFEQVRDFFASTTIVLAVDILFLFLFVGLVIVLAGWLALVPIMAIIIMGAAGFTLQRAMGQAALDAQSDSSLQQTVLIEAIGGLETLKACHAEGRMMGRWRRYADTSALTQERLRKLTATAVNLASYCQQATSVALVIGGFYMFSAGEISMGGIIAIVMIAGRSLAPVGQLAFLITRGRQAFVTLDSLQVLMDQQDERSFGSRSVVPEVKRGDIQLEDLAFRYPEAARDSLTGINLKITPGERIGIIGRVASGKSTLGRVLCGLYQPTEGTYLLDGLDSRQHNPHNMRRALRFVGQDAELFSGTIRENLMLGTVTPTDERLIEVIAESGADAFIGRDAAGFDMHIGERGSRLSGGQRSFMVMARALIDPCQLLFLDEPTGAMDTMTEKMFIERLTKAIKPDQTLIVCTHRNALLSIVDRLIVVDQGRIIADGPRDKILGNLAATASGA